MENVKSLHIITNNIKGIQNKNKRLSIIEYFINKIGKNGILFLQETHSTTSDEGKWKDEFSGPVFYSHGTSNSCGVLITFLGKNNLCVIDGSECILVNIYNANTESEQLKVLNDLSELIKKINITYGKQIVLAGDFNLFFDSNLEAKGGKPILKEKSVARMVELKEEFDLCDIWRIRNPLEKSFTFRQNYSSGILNLRLDYIFYLKQTPRIF